MYKVYNIFLFIFNRSQATIYFAKNVGEFLQFIIIVKLNKKYIFFN